MIHFSVKKDKIGFRIVNLCFAISLILLSACSTAPVKVACVGDSITEGYGLTKQSETGYPVVLNKLLGKKYTVQNCGRSATTLQKEGDFPYWIAKEFSNVFAYSPNIIIIKLGTNDTKPQNWNAERYERDYQSMIDTFRTIASDPEIFLCYPAPVFYTRWGINDSTVTNFIIPIIDNLASKNDLKIIDLHKGLNDQAENFPDGIHPNEPAAAKMAAIIAEEIIKK